MAVVTGNMSSRKYLSLGVTVLEVMPFLGRKTDNTGSDKFFENVRTSAYKT